MLLLQMLAEKKVTFYMNESVMEVRGREGKVKEVVLRSATVLPADVFIVGIGEPPTDLLSGFEQYSRISSEVSSFGLLLKMQLIILSFHRFCFTITRCQAQLGVSA